MTLRRHQVIRALKSALEPAILEAALGSGIERSDIKLRVEAYTVSSQPAVQVQFLLTENNAGWSFDLGHALDADGEEATILALQRGLAEIVIPPFLEAADAVAICHLWRGGVYSQRLVFPPLWTIERARTRALSAVMAGDSQALADIVVTLRQGVLGAVTDKEVEDFLSLLELAPLLGLRKISNEVRAGYFQRYWGL